MVAQNMPGPCQAMSSILIPSRAAVIVKHLLSSHILVPRRVKQKGTVIPARLLKHAIRDKLIYLLLREAQNLPDVLVMLAENGGSAYLAGGSGQCEGKPIMSDPPCLRVIEIHVKFPLPQLGIASE